jgi:hypothetical protein
MKKTMSFSLVGVAENLATFNIEFNNHETTVRQEQLTVT